MWIGIFQYLKLSCSLWPVDVGEVPFVMQAVCYYRNPLDAGMMKCALEKTLEKYPILAGRLDLQTPGFRNKGVRLSASAYHSIE